MIPDFHPLRPRDFRDTPAIFSGEIARHNPFANSDLNRVARYSRYFLGLRVCVRALTLTCMRVHTRGAVLKYRAYRAEHSNCLASEDLQGAISVLRIARESRKSRAEVEA